MTEEKEYAVSHAQLAKYVEALSHPARIAILTFLAQRSTCYFGDIHEELPISKATVSQHLKKLKEAGLIQGEIQPPKVKYCINRQRWTEARLLLADFFAQPIAKERCGCK